MPVVDAEESGQAATLRRSLVELSPENGGPDPWPEDADLDNPPDDMDLPDGFDDGDDDDYDETVAKNITQAYERCVDAGSSDVAVLRDDWNTPLGLKAPNCTFPFSYSGKVYYGCTNDGSFGRDYWCANDCEFSNHMYQYRGLCDIPQNTRGVLGTGVALSALNVFVALLFTVGFVVAFGVCLIECRRRSSDKYRVEPEEDAVVGGQRQFELTEQNSNGVTRT